MEKHLVHNSVTCLECGETLVSFHTHDYKTCSCDNETSVDGGTSYIRYGGVDLSLVKSLALYDDDPFEKIREVVCRGGRGIDGKQPLKYTPLKDINDEWLGAIIDYEEQYRPNNKYLPIYYKELNYRNSQLPTSKDSGLEGKP